MSKSLLVTGAHGFIGRNTARHFARTGWRVIGIGHGEWAKEEWRHWGLSEWHHADITLDVLATLAGSPDVVIHCAGGSSVSFSMTHPQQDFQRTVDTTAAVLEFLRLHAPHSRLIYPSSASVYGAAKKLPIGEIDALIPVSPYGTHKKMAEDLCCSYARQFGISAMVLRMFSVYGPGLQKQLLWDACNKIVHGNTTFFGTGEELRDWIHVNDVVALMGEVLRCGAGSGCRVVNVGTGTGTSVRDVLDLLFSGLGYSASPKFLGTEKTGDPSRYVADVTRATELGWRPRIDLRDGVAEYAKWFAGRGG